MTKLIAAVHTPFDAANGLATSVVAAQAAVLASGGVTGAFVGGTTGESLSLTVEERIQLAEAWVTPCRDHGLDLMVHVGSTTVADARRLAAHAGSIGAAAISAMAPSYFKPATLADLAASLAAIAAEAPRTPFYYYDIPSWTGVTFPSSGLLAHHAARIPTLAGIKYTSSDLTDFERCVAVDGGRFELLWGCDEALLAGLALGAAGAIGSTYNFAAREAAGVIAAFEAGDMAEARRRQMDVVRLVDVLAARGYMRGAKAVMGLLGVDCGDVRLPLRAMSPGDIADLRRDLDAAGFDAAWRQAAGGTKGVACG